jgi:hypothetical protein
LPLTSIEKFGYYKVEDQKFFNKVQALELASLKDVYPTWHFNDNTFSQYNWQLEPSLSLEEYYAQRARQLREKYDHLVLFYSGGIDSHNILTTFIKNNIKLDAVLIYGTFSLDRDQTNRFNLELYNVAIPFAQRHADKYDLKLLDISTYFDQYYHADWIYESGVQLAPYEYVMGHLYKDAYLQTWLNRGHTGFIRGIDKPRVIYHENQFYIGFLDCSMMQNPSIMLDNKHLSSDHIELFYWSPDAPWLIAKQAHIIKNYFNNVCPDLKHLLTHTNKFDYSTIEKYIVPLIYDVGISPGVKPKYYSLGKGNQGPVFHHKDSWFHSSEIELPSQKIWHQGIQHLEHSISSKFKNLSSIQNGLSGIWSKWYNLGS